MIFYIRIEWSNDANVLSAKNIKSRHQDNLDFYRRNNCRMTKEVVLNERKNKSFIDLWIMIIWLFWMKQQFYWTSEKMVLTISTGMIGKLKDGC
jgi:hypothetical protein